MVGYGPRSRLNSQWKDSYRNILHIYNTTANISNLNNDWDTITYHFIRRTKVQWWKPTPVEHEHPTTPRVKGIIRLYWWINSETYPNRKLCFCEGCSHWHTDLLLDPYHQWMGFPRPPCQRSHNPQLYWCCEPWCNYEWNSEGCLDFNSIGMGNQHRYETVACPRGS